MENAGFECSTIKCDLGSKEDILKLVDFATIHSISPGIIITPLANDELHGPRKDGYLKMIEGMPARRAGTPDEVGDLAEFLMSSRGRFISGADLLIDGGCTASYWYGDLQYLKSTH